MLRTFINICQGCRCMYLNMDPDPNFFFMDPDPNIHETICNPTRKIYFFKQLNLKYCQCLRLSQNFSVNYFSKYYNLSQLSLIWNSNPAKTVFGSDRIRIRNMALTSLVLFTLIPIMVTAVIVVVTAMHYRFKMWKDIDLHWMIIFSAT